MPDNTRPNGPIETIGRSADGPLDVIQTTTNQAFGLPVSPDFDLDRWSRSLDAKGVSYTVTKGRLRWVSGYALLDDFDRAVIREHRDEIKRRIASKLWPLPSLPEAPAAEPAPTQHVPQASEPKDDEPEPEVYVYGRRVTTADVDECFARLDDKTRRDRERGWITRQEAYSMTRSWLKQQMEMPR